MKFSKVPLQIIPTIIPLIVLMPAISNSTLIAISEFSFLFELMNCLLHLHTVVLDTLEILDGMTAHHNFSGVYIQYSSDCVLSFSPELILVFSDFIENKIYYSFVFG